MHNFNINDICRRCAFDQCVADFYRAYTADFPSSFIVAKLVDVYFSAVDLMVDVANRRQWKQDSFDTSITIYRLGARFFADLDTPGSFNYNYPSGLSPIPCGDGAEFEDFDDFLAAVDWSFSVYFK